MRQKLGMFEMQQSNFRPAHCLNELALPEAAAQGSSKALYWKGASFEVGED